MSAPLPVVSNVQLGIAGGSTPIVADLTSDPGQWTPSYVTLSASYVQASPPGFLFGTPGMLDGAPNTSRRSYNNGDRAQFWKVEADALVAADVGSYS
jgi:hypothetical protein